MNSKQIREVLTKIQSEVTCPKCNKKINPKDINITSHQQETCTLNIECKPCNFLFGGQAMFKEYLTPIGKKNECIIQNETQKKQYRNNTKQR